MKYENFIKETTLEVIPTSLLSEQQSCGSLTAAPTECVVAPPEAAWCIYSLYSSTTLH